MPARGDNLHLAASRGKAYRVAACLANDEDPNRLDAQGQTPLTISIRGGHLEVYVCACSHISSSSAHVNLSPLTLPSRGRHQPTPLQLLLGFIIIAKNRW